MSAWPEQGLIVAATSGCRPYDQSLTFSAGPIPAFTLRVNVGMCWDGTKAWTDWGPTCYVYEPLPLYVTSLTWCGVYHSGQWETNPGGNWSFAPSVAPWWNIAYPWMRYRVYGDGTSSGVWGGK